MHLLVLSVFDIPFFFRCKSKLLPVSFPSISSCNNQQKTSVVPSSDRIFVAFPGTFAGKKDDKTSVNEAQTSIPTALMSKETIHTLCIVLARAPTVYFRYLQVNTIMTVSLVRTIASKLFALMKKFFQSSGTTILLAGHPVNIPGSYQLSLHG